MTQIKSERKYTIKFGRKDKPPKIKEKRPSRAELLGKTPKFLPKDHPERKSLKEVVKESLDSKEKKISLLYTVITIGVIIATFILYGLRIWDNVACFIFTVGWIVIRAVAYIVYRLTSEETLEMVRENTDNPTLAKISFIALVSIFVLGVVMYMNLMYDFRLFARCGLPHTWGSELLYSLLTWITGLIIVGFIMVANNWEGVKKRENKEILTMEDAVLLQKRFLVIIYSFVFIITPIIFATVFIPFWIQLDQTMTGGLFFAGEYSGDSPQAHYFEGQALDDWFSYTLYIFIQAPIPSIMLAMMLFGGMVVILVQNQRGIGKTAVGFAVAFISIVPMLIVFAAFSGSIAPPDLLITVVGLSYSVAAIIHGMGLALTYLFGVSLLGVFIVTSRVLAGSWSPSGY
ncbi:MAG: hypothetical protein ACFFDB_00225 [Promethearchaeota archaeon]